MNLTNDAHTYFHERMTPTFTMAVLTERLLVL